LLAIIGAGVRELEGARVKEGAGEDLGSWGQTLNCELHCNAAIG